jgi:hypothetical protein
MLADESLAAEDVASFVADETLARCGLTPASLADIVLHALHAALARIGSSSSDGDVHSLCQRATAWRAVLALRALAPFLAAADGEQFAGLAQTLAAAEARIAPGEG